MYDGGRVSRVPSDEVLEEIALNAALRDFLGVNWLNNLLSRHRVGQIVRNGTKISRDVEVDGVLAAVRLEDNVEINIVCTCCRHNSVHTCFSNHSDGDYFGIRCSTAFGV